MKTKLVCPLLFFSVLMLAPTLQGQQTQKTSLTVLLYPWVPDYGALAATIERRFESENPGFDLVVSQQNWNYYKPGGLDPTYDVYELDGIFLQDFVRAGRIQPLDPKAVQI